MEPMKKILGIAAVVAIIYLVFLAALHWAMQ